MNITWKSVVAFVGGLSVVAGTAWGAVSATMPLLESDKPPLAGRAEVAEFKQQVAMTMSQVQQTQRSIQAHLDDQDMALVELRRRAVVREMMDIKDALVKRPHDRLLLGELDHDTEDLADIESDRALILKQKRKRGR